MAFDNIMQLPEELLFLWHTHRVEVLLSAGVLFAIVRLVVHWRSRKAKVALTPPLASPVDEKSAIALAPNATDVKAQLAETDHYEPTVTAKKPVRPKAGPKRVTGGKKSKVSPVREIAPEQIQPVVFYYSLGGSTRAYAEKFAEKLSQEAQDSRILSPETFDLTELDYDDFFISPPKPKNSDKRTAFF